MSAYTKFFLDAVASAVELELLEISHPNFSQTYFIVRNKADGVTVTLETGASQAFVYFPLQIKGVSSNDSLDQVLQCQIGDLGQVVPLELDRVNVAGGWGTKPTCKLRTYNSDDLSAPLTGPIVFQITTIVSTEEGSSFDAAAPEVNAGRTGEFYSIERFPMMAGFTQ